MLRNLIFLLSTLVFVTAFSVSAASVYKVSKGDSTLYLGGTMHILSEQDYPLPHAYKQAYQASQKLVFETDMAAMQSAEFQAMSMQMAMFGDGRTLEDVLSIDTIKQLKAHLSSRQIPYETVKGMKPGFVGITLSVIELTTIGLNSPGVDAYYHQMASSDGKAIAWLETPLEQLTFLAKMGEGNSDEYIEYTLQEVQTMPDSVAKLKAAWLSGDLKALERVGITPWAEDHPDIYSLVLSSRNNNWMQSIDSMLDTEPTEFVLVGALHLAGKDGLIAQLKAKGYSISKI